MSQPAHRLGFQATINNLKESYEHEFKQFDLPMTILDAHGSLELQDLHCVRREELRQVPKGQGHLTDLLNTVLASNPMRLATSL